MITILLIVLPGFAAVAAYIVLRLGRDRCELAHREAFNTLIVPNLDDETFDRGEIARLPAPAARYLSHAIRPDTPLSRTVDLRLTGRVRAHPQDEWLSFEAHHRICAGRGFICRSRLEGLRRLAVDGADYLVAGEAHSEFFLAGIIPVVRRRGADITRSAAGRLLLESIWLPATLLPSRGARWHSGDGQRTTVEVDGHPDPSPLTLTVDDDGRLRTAAMMRYRDGNGPESGLTPFGLRVERESSFDGYTVPAQATASWGFGTDEAFDWLTLEVAGAHYY